MVEFVGVPIFLGASKILDLNQKELTSMQMAEFTELLARCYGSLNGHKTLTNSGAPFMKKKPLELIKVNSEDLSAKMRAIIILSS